MGKKGKKYPAHQIARKKILDDQKSPPPPCPQELNGRPLICKPIKHTKEVVLQSYVNFLWQGANNLNPIPPDGINGKGISPVSYDQNVTGTFTGKNL